VSAGIQYPPYFVWIPAGVYPVDIWTPAFAGVTHGAGMTEEVFIGYETASKGVSGL